MTRAYDERAAADALARELFGDGKPPCGWNEAEWSGVEMIQRALRDAYAAGVNACVSLTRDRLAGVKRELTTETLEETWPSALAASSLTELLDAIRALTPDAGGDGGR